MNIACVDCKFNGNCESKAKALWMDRKGGDILGCNLGEADKVKIKAKIEQLSQLLKEQ